MRPAVRKKVGDGNGERGAFFRVGGRAELVEQDERVRCRRDARGDRD